MILKIVSICIENINKKCNYTTISTGISKFTLIFLLSLKIYFFLNRISRGSGRYSMHLNFFLKTSQYLKMIKKQGYVVHTSTTHTLKKVLVRNEIEKISYACNLDACIKGLPSPLSYNCFQWCNVVLDWKDLSRPTIWKKVFLEFTHITQWVNKRFIIQHFLPPNLVILLSKFKSEMLENLALCG